MLKIEGLADSNQRIKTMENLMMVRSLMLARRFNRKDAETPRTAKIFLNVLCGPSRLSGLAVNNAQCTMSRHAASAQQLTDND